MLVFSIPKQNLCFVQSSDALWTVPGHVEELGQIAVVFSVDDGVLGHQGNLGEPGEGHCPGEVTKSRSYLGLLISGWALYRVFLLKPHSSVYIWTGKYFRHPNNQTGRLNSWTTQRLVTLARGRVWWWGWHVAVTWGCPSLCNECIFSTNFWKSGICYELWHHKTKKILSLKGGKQIRLSLGSIYPEEDSRIRTKLETHLERQELEPPPYPTSLPPALPRLLTWPHHPTSGFGG